MILKNPAALWSPQHLDGLVRKNSNFCYLISTEHEKFPEMCV